MFFSTNILCSLHKKVTYFRRIQNILEIYFKLKHKGQSGSSCASKYRLLAVILERVLKINIAQNIYFSVFFYGILKKKVVLVMPKRYELERVEKSSNLLLRRLNIDVFTCLNFHLPRCAR